MEGQDGLMAESQKNHRDVKENYDGKVYIKEGHFMPEDDLVEAKEKIRSFDKANLEQAQERAIPVEEVLVENGKEKLDLVYQAVRDNFKGRGIEDVTLSPVFFLPRKDEDEKGQELGSSYRTHVEAENLKELDQPLLKEIETLRLVAHELYHNTAVHVFKAYNNEHGGMTLLNTKAGATHVNAHNINEGLAFEEGAAVIFEREILEKIIPEEDLKMYDDVISEFVIHEEDSAVDGSRPRITVDEFDSETNLSSAGFNTDYKNSELLVRYIKSKIDNFDQKLEQSRIHLKTLDLARSIEKEFGDGTYRRVTTCTTSEAGDLLMVLKGIEFLKKDLSKDQ